MMQKNVESSNTNNNNNISSNNSSKFVTRYGVEDIFLDLHALSRAARLFAVFPRVDGSWLPVFFYGPQTVLPMEGILCTCCSFLVFACLSHWVCHQSDGPVSVGGLGLFRFISEDYETDSPRRRSTRYR